MKYDPWSDLSRHFDLTVWLDVSMDELEGRLIRRWRSHGYDEDCARGRALSNDIPNARLVVSCSRPADVVVRERPAETLLNCGLSRL